MPYQLTVQESDVCRSADNIPGILDHVRQILIDRAGTGLTTVVITDPAGGAWPLAQQLHRSSADPAARDAVIDNLLYDVSAALHWAADHPTDQPAAG